MPSLKPNHRQILAAQPVGGKRTRYRIEGVPGLWLNVCPTGKRTWYVRNQPGGRKGRVFRQYTIGDAKTVGLAKASKAAHNVINAVKVEDRDPVAERTEKKREALTFGDIFDDWYERPLTHSSPVRCLRLGSVPAARRGHRVSGDAAFRLRAQERSGASAAQLLPTVCLVLSAPQLRKRLFIAPVTATYRSGRAIDA